MEKIYTSNNFQIVKQLHVDLNMIFSEIDDKMKELNQMYQDMVKTHHDKNYMFGLDSFYFQNKLIRIEYDNMKNVFNFIDNRIYCEYYKLHRMLYDFIRREIKEKTIVEKLSICHKKYPVYKDLEPTKLYDFHITVEINNTIKNAIQELKNYISDQKEEMKEERKRSDMGLNIHSIIHEQVYNNIILEEGIHMFENYLNTFISHHSKYFSRLTLKLKIMLGIVNEDFHLKNKKTLIQRDTLTTINLSDTLCVSSSSDTSPPKLSMNNNEEINVRCLFGDTDASKELQTELNTILEHVSIIM